MDIKQARIAVEQLNQRLNDLLASELAAFEKEVGLPISTLKLNAIDITDMGSAHTQYIYQLSASLNI